MGRKWIRYILSFQVWQRLICCESTISFPLRNTGRLCFPTSPIMLGPRDQVLNNEALVKVIWAMPFPGLGLKKYSAKPCIFSSSSIYLFNLNIFKYYFIYYLKISKKQRHKMEATWILKSVLGEELLRRAVWDHKINPLHSEEPSVKYDNQ